MSYPAKYKMRVRQGQTFNRVFTWSVNDDPVNLTGFDGRMQVRRRPSASSNVVLDATPYISLGGTTGAVTIDIPASVTEDITPATYVYDLELDNGGTVTTLLAGNFVVDAEVTR
jgi:hypothetical protein